MPFLNRDCSNSYKVEYKVTVINVWVSNKVSCTMSKNI